MCLAANTERFQTFGGDHIALLLAVTLLTTWFINTSARRPESRKLKLAERVLAILLLAHWPMQVALGMIYQPDSGWQQILPMHLCEWAAFAAGIALLTKRQLAIELCWFWGLGGTLQGLLTPALTYPFPHPYWFIFFLLHGGIVIAALQMVIGRGNPPSRRSWLHAVIATEMYFITAVIVNTSCGTNFGFLAAKPSQPSILDYFGDWPYYLIPIQIGFATAITLLWLPFQIKRAKE